MMMQVCACCVAAVRAAMGKHKPHAPVQATMLGVTLDWTLGYTRCAAFMQPASLSLEKKHAISFRQGPSQALCAPVQAQLVNLSRDLM